MTDRIIEIEIFGHKHKIKVKGEEDEKYIGRYDGFPANPDGEGVVTTSNA